MSDTEILIAVIEQQRNEAMSALAQAIARGEMLSRRIADLESLLASESVATERKKANN